MYIYGEIPSGFVILSSCDPIYLRDHAPAFIASCALAKNAVHLHIISPSADDLAFAYTLRLRAKKISSDFVMTITAEDTNLRDLNPEQRRTYYACNRFLVAEKLMYIASDLDMFITDIDCVLIQHVDQPKEDVGLFLREPLPGTVGWEAQGTRVAAGAVYYSRKASFFCQDVADIIHSNPLRWFLDQVAINTVYEQNKDDINIVFKQFDSNLMDWEFREGTVIWTGKGSRKYHDKTYLAKKASFSDQLPEMEQIAWSAF
jgi:hypothetical protein